MRVAYWTYKISPGHWVGLLCGPRDIYEDCGAALHLSDCIWLVPGTED